MDKYDPDYSPTHARFLLGVKVLIINEKNEILLLKRSNKVSRPHGWDFPGGGVDKGESPKNAAIRETREETTLNVNHLRLMSTYLAKTDNEDDLIIGYVAYVNNGTVELVGWEHDDFRWVTLDELEDLELPKEHVSVVDAYKRTFLE